MQSWWLSPSIHQASKSIELSLMHVYYVIELLNGLDGLIIINCNNMYKIKKILKTTLYYASISITTASIAGYGYLQYIQNILGPIDIDKQNAIRFYKSQHKMEDSQASRTYYWVIAHIALNRIISFNTYQSLCSMFINKIVEPTLNNYQQHNIIQQIEKVPDAKPTRINRNIFNKIVDIRKINTENIDNREYLVKEIRTLQKELYSNLLLNLPDNNRNKIDKIHKYICQMGKIFKDPQILKYIQKLPQIQDKYPRDYLHKILFI